MEFQINSCTVNSCFWVRYVEASWTLSTRVKFRHLRRKQETVRMKHWYEYWYIHWMLEESKFYNTRINVSGREKIWVSKDWMCLCCVVEDRRKCKIELTAENVKSLIERKCTTPHFYYTFYKSRGLPCPGQPLEPEPKYHELTQWDFEFEVSTKCRQPSSCCLTNLHCMAYIADLISHYANSSRR